MRGFEEWQTLQDIVKIKTRVGLEIIIAGHEKMQHEKQAKYTAMTDNHAFSL